jgi:hypothetical protein
LSRKRRRPPPIPPQLLALILSPSSSSGRHLHSSTHRIGVQGAVFLVVAALVDAVSDLAICVTHIPHSSLPPPPPLLPHLPARSDAHTPTCDHRLLLLLQGYSGDWSRIGVITPEVEKSIRDIAPLSLAVHSAFAVGSYTSARKRGWSQGNAAFVAVKTVLCGTVALIEALLAREPGAEAETKA